MHAARFRLKNSRTAISWRPQHMWRGDDVQRAEPRKPRTRAAISSAAVSNAKWPPSTM